MTPVRLPPEMTPTDVARNLLLLRASETLSVTATTADVVDAVLELRGTGLDASNVHIVLAGGYPDPLTERTVRDRRAFYFTDGAELAAAFPDTAKPGAQAAACVPVVGTAGALGALHLRWDAPRTFFVTDRAVTATLAAYIARALERAQRLNARIGVADTLQEAILSRLPTVERYELAAHYLPADRQEKVGGDWYDAVAGRDGQLTMVIGDVVGQTGVTVADYLWQWHRSRKIEATTLSGYAGHIRNYLIPNLGHLPVDELRVGHIQNMFDTIADRTTTAVEIARNSDDPAARAAVKGSRITSAATMHRIRATLRKALDDAIRRHRIIEFNPAAHIELPSGKRPKTKVWTAAAVTAWRATGARPSTAMVWTPTQAGAFLDYAETHDVVLYPLFALILHRGLRRGEAVGLRDADVDLDTGTITICQQITTLDGRPITKKVKSDAGDRSIRLGDLVTTELRTYQARRARWQLVAGPAGPTPDCSSSNPAASPTTPKSSAPASNNSSPTPGYHRSACTTCGTAPPRSSKPPVPT